MSNKKAIIAICPECGAKNAIIEGDEACVCRECGSPFVVDAQSMSTDTSTTSSSLSSNTQKGTWPPTDKNFNSANTNKKKESQAKENGTREKETSEEKATGKSNKNTSKTYKDSITEATERLKDSIENSINDTTENFKSSINTKQEEIFTKIKSVFEANKIKVIAIASGALILLGGIIGISVSGDKSNEDDSLVKAPKSSSSYAGSNYEDVYEQFVAAGFSNVTTSPEGDMVIGLFSSEGDVDVVTIDGDSAYSRSTKFNPDVHVNIKYHSFPVKETVFDTYPIEDVSEEIIAAVVGTYVGNDGCGVTFFDDGTCDFYFPSKNIIESDQWTYGEGKLQCYSEYCSCYIIATISADNAKVFDFVSDSINWQDETYVKVLDTAEHIDTEKYDELYKNTDFKSSLVLGKLKYPDVEKKLKNDGYANITTKGTEDMIMGFLVEENQVKSVSIDGVTYFTDYSTFDKDTSITITYYSYPPSGEYTSSTSSKSDNSEEKKENESDLGLQEYKEEYAFPMRTIVVAVTNYFADDNWLDGNTKDLSKNHTYSDLSGFYMIVKQYGQWVKLTDENGKDYFHCEHMILQGYNVTIPCNITSADIYPNEDDSYTIKSLDGNIGEVKVGEILTYGQEFLTVAKDYINEDRTDANPEAEQKKKEAEHKEREAAQREVARKQQEIDQENERREYSIQALMARGDNEFSYCKWSFDEEYATKNSDGSYFVKKAATVKNAYGQKVKVWMEGTARGSDIYDLYIENFNVYVR